MPLPFVYMDPVSGSDSNDGTILAPVQTAANALSKVSPGGTLVAAASGSLGALSFSGTALRLRAPKGITASCGPVTGSDVSFVAENISFPSGVQVVNSTRSGAVALRQCRFTGTAGALLNKVQYISLHRNHFDNCGSGITVQECLEASVGDNLLHAVTVPVSFTSAKNLDFYHNTVDSCGELFFDDFASGVAFNVSYYTITPAILAAKQVHVSGVPLSVAVNLLIAQDYGTDYTVIGNSISWDGLGMEADIASGDVLRVVYEAQGGTAADGVIRLDSNSLSSNAAGITFSSGDYASMLYNNLFGTPCIVPGGGSMGNIASDPMYVAPGSNYSLQNVSPNAGWADPALWLTAFLQSAQSDLNTDYAGVERDYDSHAPSEDVGAYEFPGATGIRTSPFVNVSGRGHDTVGTGDLAKPFKSVGRATLDGTTDPVSVGVLGSTGAASKRAVSLEGAITFAGTRGISTSGGFTGIPNQVAFRATPGTVVPTGSASWVSAASGGDTGAGTLASPYRTISKALSVSSVAIVLPGHYPGFTGAAGTSVVPLTASYGSTGTGYRVDEASGRTWTVSEQAGADVYYFYGTVRVVHTP